jgi:hypothetical protein
MKPSQPLAGQRVENGHDEEDPACGDEDCVEHVFLLQNSTPVSNITRVWFVLSKLLPKAKPVMAWPSAT